MLLWRTGINTILLDIKHYRMLYAIGFSFDGICKNDNRTCKSMSFLCIASKLEPISSLHWSVHLLIYGRGMCALIIYNFAITSNCKQQWFGFSNKPALWNLKVMYRRIKFGCTVRLQNKCNVSNITFGWSNIALPNAHVHVIEVIF